MQFKKKKTPKELKSTNYPKEQIAREDTTMTQQRAEGN